VSLEITTMMVVFAPYLPQALAGHIKVLSISPLPRLEGLQVLNNGVQQFAFGCHEVRNKEHQGWLPLLCCPANDPTSKYSTL